MKSTKNTAINAEQVMPPSETDLNGIVHAAEGRSTPDPTIERPPIQPAASVYSVKDAIANMWEPPLKPPTDPGVMRHSSTLPSVAFRTKPRVGDGFFLWMVSTPFGEAKQGESFTRPVVGPLIVDLRKECPTLFAKRYEIRLVLSAGDNEHKYSLLEVPADPLPTRRGEDNRRSMMKAIQHSEAEWVVAERLAGQWGTTPAAHEYPVVWLDQEIADLANVVYSEDLLTSMDEPYLQRFRKKIR
jgi:hypothetical protein